MKRITLAFLCLLLAIPLFAQWSTDKLSEARSELASFGLNGNIYFVGGKDDFAGSDILDIYNVADGTWTTEELPASAIGWELVDAGDYFVFVNGSGTVSGRMMIYDKRNDSWRSSSEINSRFGDAIAGMNNKVYFAGGGSGTSKIKTINILDLETDSWSIDSLSVARGNATVAYHGSKIFFMGGDININFSVISSVVDVLDTSNNTWETFNMAEEKYRLSLEVIGDQLILGGGQISNNLISGFTDQIEVIDLSDYSSTTYSMSNINGNMASEVVDGKVVFVGGRKSIAEIFDPSDNSVQSFPFRNASPSIVKSSALGKRAFFTGVNDNRLDLVHIYDSELNEWTEYDMGSSRRFVDMVAHQSKMMIAGGNANNVLLDEVHIFEDSSLIVTATKETINETVRVFPNPASNHIQIDLKEAGNHTVHLYDLYGQHLLSQSNPSSIDVSSIPSGLYLLEVASSRAQGTKVVKLVIDK